MGCWRLHVLLPDDDPLIGALLADVISGRSGRDVVGNGLAALAAVEALETAVPVLVAIEPRGENDGRDVTVLTTQERRTLQLSADGRSIRETAAELFISPTTVKTHLRHAAEKLGVRGRAAAVAEALRRGLII